MSKYIYLVLFILLATSSGTAYFLYKDNAEKEAKIQLLSRDVQLLKDANETMLNRHNEILTEYAFYRGKTAGIVEEQSRREQEYESYRSRLGELSLAKPGLIEIKANKATIKVFDEFEKETQKP